MNITIAEGGVLVSEYPPGLLDILQYTYTWQERLHWKKVWRSEKRKLYHVDPEGDLIVFPGLLERIQSFCDKKGIVYTWQDIRPPLPEPDFSTLKPLRERQDEALATIIGNYNGIIQMPPGAGKSFMIGQLIRIYPSLKILVTCPQVSIIEDLFLRCCTETEDLEVPIDCIVSGSRRSNQKSLRKKNRKEARVVICSTGSLHRIKPDWPDLLIFDECHEASTPTRLAPLTPFLHTRIFGFSATPFGRPDGTDTETEAMFGPVRYVVTHSEGVESRLGVPIEVRMLRVKGPEIQKPKNDIWVQRLGYWQHAERNSVALKYVKAAFEDTAPVLFLVRSAEHAFVLHSMSGYSMCYRNMMPATWCTLCAAGYGILFTPEEEAVAVAWADEQYKNGTRWKNRWKMLTDAFLAGCRSSSYEALKDCDVESIKADLRSSKITRVIATTVFKQGVDFPDLQAVVRMDGMTGRIPSVQIGGRPGRITETKQVGIVIDFMDDYGSYFLNRSYERKEKYEEEGWHVTVC